MSFSQEPAVYIAIIDALLVLAVTFGLPLTPEQKGSIDAVLAAVAGILIRSRVTPTANVAATMSDITDARAARAAGTTSGVDG